MSHPCRNCGACCAFFRVEFYWREANYEDYDLAVPVELTEDVNEQKRCMKGTNGKATIRCIALKGKIGQEVSCDIYGNRATPCREFEASYENGEPNYRCDQARERYGLRPLKRDDWPQINSAEINL